jgi:signal transduction histidine kinase/ligand-binding sensor domain-containing protein
MKGKIVVWCTVIFCWLLCSCLYAQKNSIRFKHISIAQGLSQSTVYCIRQDSKGFMWFGTQEGLNRYDGYKFKQYKHDPTDAKTISDNYVWTLYEDKNGVLWIGTFFGLNRFDRERETFTHYKQNKDAPSGLSHNDVRVIYEDHDEDLWIGTGGGGLNKLDRKTGKFERFMSNTKSDKESLSHNDVRAIYEDGHGVLWIGTAGGGLNRFNRKTKKFTHYTNENSNLNHHDVRTIYEDRHGVLWIGTRGGGLNHFNRETGKFTYYTNENSNLSHHDVRTIYEDRAGGFWIGTYNGGLNKLYDREKMQFTHYKHDAANPHSLSKNEVLCIYEDQAGVLWIGTRGGGLNIYDRKNKNFNLYPYDVKNVERLNLNDVRAIYEDNSGVLWVGFLGGGLIRCDRKKDTLIQYKHDESDPYSLGHDEARAIREDRSGVLWVGTLGGGLNKLVNRKKGRFKRYMHDEKDAGSLSSNDVLSVYEDRFGFLWIGTLGGGLNKFDPDPGRFVRYNHNEYEPSGLSGNQVRCIYEDRAGVLWIGTDEGLNKFHRETETFIRYKNNPRQPGSLSHNRVRCIYEDRSGVLWIGTKGGLNKFDRNEEKFEHFREEDGLCNNVIYGILEDNRGNLWLSTNRGLSRFDPAAGTFKNYDFDDGLQGNEFNAGAYFKSTRTGEMFFGGINGFNAFFPGKIEDNLYVPPVVITDFLIFNKPVLPERKNPGSPLQKPIDQTGTLVLNHKQNVFSFEFAALHYASPGRNQYKYKLDGWDKHWNETDAENRRATYTNLPSGDYIFRVKGSNKDGIWNNKGTSIRLRILPPPWKTWWAYTLYILAITGIITGYVLAQSKKVKKERLMARKEREMNRRLLQMDRLKDEFLSNTSHELRTPLNGIIGLTESLIDGAAGPVSQKLYHDLSMVVSSGKRLANLVNDIMDFTRLKSDSLQLQFKQLDLRSLTDVVFNINKSLIAGKNLELVNEIDPDFPAVKADEDRLEQVLHNLVGNAVKFTESGKVTVSAEVRDDMVYIRVADTGIGIPEEKFERIFESFAQVEGSMDRVYGGTGLGLAVTKKLVELHGGKIWVESTPGKGSCFTFTLPVFKGKAAEAAAKVKADVQVPRLEPLTQGPREEIPVGPGFTPADGDYHILVVDDDPINRQVIINRLSMRNYTISEASGGHEALRALENRDFDLILLDIMMPRMSGYEVCRRIRERFSFHELPVIFLTARNQVTDMVAAFNAGGSDFVSKPVYRDELLARIKTQLELLDINRKLEQKVKKRTRELIETQEKVTQLEKMRALGALVGAVAHELNNPAAAVNTGAYNLENKLNELKGILRELIDNDDEILAYFDKKLYLIFEHLDSIKKGTISIKNIVDELRIFSRTDPMKEVKPVRILQNTLNTIKFNYSDRVNFSINYRYDPLLTCNPNKIGQVFRNIMENACQAIIRKQDQSGEKKKGNLTVSTCKKKGFLVIRFEDTGIGMSRTVRKKIFEPFFTTKPEGEGIGLGLYISFEIIDKHGGRIEVESEEGKGAVFTIHLPLKKGKPKDNKNKEQR